MNHSYRDEELQLWTSSGQMMQADEEPQLIPRFCILNQRGRASLWKNTDRRSSLITQPPSLSLHPRHSCLLQEAIQHSAFTSLDSLVINFSQEVTGTRLNSNVRDIFRLMTTDQCKSLIIFCDEDIPPHLSSNICYDKDSGVFMGNPGCNINDNNNVSSDLTNLTVHTLCEPNNNDSKDSQSEMVIRDCFHDGKCKCVLKSCQKCNNLGVSSGRDRNVKMSRSVSFDEEVIVYMFDQDSPISELHSEPCISHPGRHSSDLSDDTLEDIGLEWEDDFSALETNRHFQYVRHRWDRSFSLPTPGRTSLARPERLSLSQTCLFLIHVTESDLEL
ncbi:class A basic helix-loop-helix protein 15 isoform X1 [Anabas testudineus]|uniref:class A basic helix-loop-helix protein 15 isoform X1 n=1 Tax=Anabas testudineus TaxID=64144 RepID=UPI000E4556C4|nr:class A basic helix-loop-helix protein 15 isoform X1 [Anabas testudineus]XP_026207158.1 class A basic helix-loop-helix protein 15 isoform X1 [Anabas testudineus]